MNRIREMAKEKKIPIMSIVRITKLSRSFIYEVMDGECYPEIRNAWKISKAIGSTPDEVFPDNNY